MNMIEVDGYKATIEYGPELDQFRGEILGLNGSADFLASVFSIFFTIPYEIKCIWIPAC